MGMGLQPGPQGQVMQLANGAGMPSHSEGGQHQLMNQGFPGQPGQPMAQSQDGKMGEKGQGMQFPPPAGLGDLAGRFATATQPAQQYDSQAPLPLAPPFGAAPGLQQSDGSVQQ